MDAWELEQVVTDLEPLAGLLQADNGHIRELDLRPRLLSGRHCAAGRSVSSSSLAGNGGAQRLRTKHPELKLECRETKLTGP